MTTSTCLYCGNDDLPCQADCAGDEFEDEFLEYEVLDDLPPTPGEANHTMPSNPMPGAGDSIGEVK